MAMWLATLASLGHGDCEAMRAGLLHQPANAVSSLAFLAAGAWIAYRATRVPGERAELLTFAAAVAANGIASFLFHGPAPGGSRWAHDVAALSLPVFVAAHDAGLVRRWAPRVRLAWFGGAITIVAIVIAVWPDALVALGFASALAAGAGEAGAFRAGYRPRPGDAEPLQLAAWSLVLVALALGGLAFLFGRTGSPLCRPGSLAQIHAAWHLLVAVAAAAYAWAAFELRGSAQ
ncbi:MAG: hypothetical protein ACXWXS_00965 [Actinomycetota bacterium]